MHEDCDICGGFGRIRLPVRAKMVFRTADYASPIARTDDSVREFACPHCTKPKREHIKLFGVEVPYRGEIKDRHPDYEARVMQDAVMKLGAAAFKEGLFTVERRQLEKSETAFGESHAMRVTVGFVQKLTVEKLDVERKAYAKEQISKVLDDVVRDACKEIATWGSAYNGTAIHKHQAADAIDGAAKRALQKLSEWK